MRVLLHSCCAPCAIPSIEDLAASGHSVECLFYNPNVHPYKEHERRLEALRMCLSGMGVPLHVPSGYELEAFFRGAAFREANRCEFCYLMRLGEAARFARENGFDAFTTTLLISPYQQHELIKKSGEFAALEHGSAFLYRDFRPLFRKGQEEARRLGLYRQSYCGCVYSEKERYYKLGDRD